jgi:fumarate reductase subunit D
MTASTRAGAALAVLGSLLGLYLTSVIAGMLLSLLSLAITSGLPASDVISDHVNYLSAKLIYPDLLIIIVLFLSAFIAMNGTDAAMRISDEDEARKDGGAG